MSTDRSVSLRGVDGPAPKSIKIDGTGEPGHAMTLSLENGTRVECKVGPDELWMFELALSDLEGLSAITKATITATTQRGHRAEEEIWLDRTTGELFGYDPVERAATISAQHVSLTDALTSQFAQETDPLTPYGVRMFDFRLARFDSISIEIGDRQALSEVSALVLHGDATHTLHQTVLSATGRREEMGERTYDIYTWDQVDIAVDSEIRIVS